MLVSSPGTGNLGFIGNVLYYIELAGGTSSVAIPDSVLSLLPWRPNSLAIALKFLSWARTNGWVYVQLEKWIGPSQIYLSTILFSKRRQRNEEPSRSSSGKRPIKKHRQKKLCTMYFLERIEYQTTKVELFICAYFHFLSYQNWQKPGLVGARELWLPYSKTPLYPGIHPSGFLFGHVLPCRSWSFRTNHAFKFAQIVS